MRTSCLHIIASFIILALLDQGNKAAASSWLPDSVAAQVVYAEDGGTGTGAELGWEPLRNWYLRLNAIHFSEQQEHLISLINFSEDRERTDISLILDRKFGADNAWHVSVGVIHPGEGTHLGAEPDENFAYFLNGRQYAGAHLNEPKGHIEYDSLAPYVGIGWKSPARSSWHFGIDIGLVAGLNPRLTIRTDNPFHLPFLDQDLQAEADKYMSLMSDSPSVMQDGYVKITVAASYQF